MAHVYRLESGNDFNRWTHIRIWPKNGDPKEGDVFALNEPVWVVNLYDADMEPSVLWIDKLDYRASTAAPRDITVRSSRVASHDTDYYEVEPRFLRKLPAMVRLAVESSDD